MQEAARGRKHLNVSEPRTVYLIVLCAVLLTLVILSSNSVPDPESGVKSFE